jgi:hypothetical protein
MVLLIPQRSQNAATTGTFVLNTSFRKCARSRALVLATGTFVLNTSFRKRARSRTLVLVVLSEADLRLEGHMTEKKWGHTSLSIQYESLWHVPWLQIPAPDDPENEVLCPAKASCLDPSEVVAMRDRTFDRDRCIL